MRIRMLQDPNSDRIMISTVEGKKLIIESGKKGKTRFKEKELESNYWAVEEAQKQERALIKKGYTVVNEEPRPGEPLWHVYLDKGYSGCLALAYGEDYILTIKTGDYVKGIKDALVFVSKEGSIMETQELPVNLPWELLYHAQENLFYMVLGDSVFGFNPRRKEFMQLSQGGEAPGSFISIGGQRLAFCSLPDLKIKKLNSQKEELLFSKKISAELYSGHTTQVCGSLSKTGEMLALCTRSGEIQLLDAGSGQVLGSIEADFEMIDQLAFADSDKLLVAVEKYGTWALRYFDVEKRQELHFPALHTPTGRPHSFCFNDKQSKMAVISRTQVFVFDFHQKQLLHSFNADHIVKTGNILFIGEELCVRSDSSFLSLYKV